VNVRRARPSDAAVIASFIGDMGYTVPAEVVAQRLHDLPEGHTVLVATAGEEPRGWIHLVLSLSLISGPRVELAGLAVGARYQRTGVGGALLRRAEEWAAQRGAASVYVRSGAQREAAHRFYEGHGYTRLKTQVAFSKAVTPR
jgi:GNAT superfamily N-acetyltransferase